MERTSLEVSVHKCRGQNEKILLFCKRIGQSREHTSLEVYKWRDQNEKIIRLDECFHHAWHTPKEA